ncbi:MAG: 30S ribosomal protein S16 [Candidatus Marinimicrobia bacterium]|nr:30S ribosomal protein S16 [Candidatus Neomarinimicrobiota bacterium]
MAVRIRLLRMGRKKKPFYRIVVMDSRTRRDGRYLDKIGYYNPVTKPAEVSIDKDKVLEWLKKGAEPSQTVFNLLQKEGIALDWHLIRNKVSEHIRNVELQKWELSKKVRETKITEAKGEKVQEEAAVKEEAAPKAETEEPTVAEPEESKEPKKSEEPVEEVPVEDVKEKPKAEKPEVIKEDKPAPKKEKKPAVKKSKKTVKEKPEPVAATAEPEAKEKKQNEPAEKAKTSVKEKPEDKKNESAK